MEKLFNPKSIAVVGASADKQKIGAAVMLNLINGGYQGKIIPINPKREKIFDFRCYASLLVVPDEIDLVVVAVPANAVLEVVKQTVAKEIPYIIVISAGFAENGDEGKARELALLEAIAGSKTRLLGPNCLGVASSAAQMNASFAAQMPASGNIAFLSQSGAFNTAMLDMAAQAKLGFAYFVSVGNMADINEIELLKYWERDEQVEVVGMYLEEFSGARELMAIAQNSRKPVVILHPGDSQSAQAAIASHTGSLAGGAMTANAAMQKANVIKVSDVTEMFNVLSMLSWIGMDDFGERIAIVTNAGGPGIVATDLIEAHGMRIVELSGQVQEKLREFLPGASSVHNPVDLLGDARADRYGQAIELLTDSDEMDTVIVVLTPQYMTEVEETAEVIAKLAQTSNKYILPLFLGGEKIDEGIAVFHKHGLAAFKSLAEGVQALSKIVEWKERRLQTKYDMAFDKFVGLERTIDLNEYLTGGSVTLPYFAVEQLMQQVGIRQPKERLVGSREEALQFAAEENFPVVLKATADQIIHKTDDKAIYLNIMSESELSVAYELLFETVAKLTKQSAPRLLIQKQLQAKDYLELLLGANRSGSSRVYEEREAGFGHLIVFGHGGIYTEVYKDINSAILPLNHAEIEQLITTTKVFQIIDGARAQMPLAQHLLIELIGKVQLLLMTYPEIISLDINPVFLSTTDCLAMDVKIFVG
jgi:acetyl coenzyme A synthetase (ADP forming)-like protein